VSGIVVGADGKGIAQAIVFVQSPVAAETTPAAAQPRATMDQINKTFVPGVLPIVVGSEVRFPNHDQVQHHVYSFSRVKTFELPLYKGQEAGPVRFDKPGLVKIGCNIHDWMSAVILVLPNSHFTVTDSAGHFTLAGLPPGKLTLGAWHELALGKLEDTLQLVEVGAGTGAVTFRLTLGAPKKRPPQRGLRGDP
jgi:plastocyanin